MIKVVSALTDFLNILIVFFTKVHKWYLPTVTKFTKRLITEKKRRKEIKKKIKVEKDYAEDKRNFINAR